MHLAAQRAPTGQTGTAVDAVDAVAWNGCNGFGGPQQWLADMAHPRLPA